MATEKPKYSFWKTVEKVGVFLLELLLAGAVVWITDKPEFIFLAPLFEGIRNWLKNRNK